MQNIIFEDATLQPPVQTAILCPRNDETPASSKHRRHHLRHILQTSEVQDCRDKQKHGQQDDLEAAKKLKVGRRFHFARHKLLHH